MVTPPYDKFRRSPQMHGRDCCNAQSDWRPAVFSPLLQGCPGKKLRAAPLTSARKRLSDSHILKTDSGSMASIR
jgi:hypothetical protein